MYNNYMKLIDLTGKRFGRLIAQNYIGNRRWNCLCDCGKETSPLALNLTKGNTKSCGCIRTEKRHEIPRKHGFYGTKAYKSWCSIKKRCTNPKDPAYKNYGAKGIFLCNEWLNDPKAFCEYVGVAPSEKHSIDRIDNSKGYEHGNVRWADDYGQANNKTTNVKIEFQGQSFQSISEFIRWLAPQLKVKKVSLQRELVKHL
jgi:hypothetical protein